MNYFDASERVRNALDNVLTKLGAGGGDEWAAALQEAKDSLVAYNEAVSPDVSSLDPALLKELMVAYPEYADEPELYVDFARACESMGMSPWPSDEDAWMGVTTEEDEFKQRRKRAFVGDFYRRLREGMDRFINEISGATWGITGKRVISDKAERAFYGLKEKDVAVEVSIWDTRDAVDRVRRLAEYRDLFRPVITEAVENAQLSPAANAKQLAGYAFDHISKWIEAEIGAAPGRTVTSAVGIYREDEPDPPERFRKTRIDRAAMRAEKGCIRQRCPQRAFATREAIRNDRNTRAQIQEESRPQDYQRLLGRDQTTTLI